MIEKLEIRTQFGTMLTLLMQNSTNGLYIKEIDGLDPTKSNIVTSSFARQPGTQRQASRRESRDLKIKLGFDPNFNTTTVESLRTQLYDFFMTGMQVEVRFYSTSGLVVDVSGEVEDFISPRMVQDPEATIQIFCFDPDFRGITVKEAPGESGAVDSYGVLDYVGSVETGFIFTLTLPDDRLDFSFFLVNVADDGLERIIDFSNIDTIAGDKISISTLAGDKGAWRDRGGSISNLLNYVSPFSDWINLFRGQNRITLVVSPEGMPVPFTIEYVDKFGGI